MRRSSLTGRCKSWTGVGRSVLLLFVSAVSVLADEPELKRTLLLPADAALPVPAVLLIAGSGPTDRDGNSAGLPGKNDSLKMIAVGLAGKGIASLRYDKRGIGESRAAAASESDLRFENYVDDAVMFCNLLKADRRFRGVVVVGHSEGSLIGMIAAKRCGAAGFVSLSGAGRPAVEILRIQLADKLPPELAEKSEAVLRALEAGKTTPDPPAELAALYRPSVQPYLISWFKYDPSKEIAALSAPVLIVQGSTDIQTSVDDAKRLAAANRKSKLLVIDGMNHVLKMVSGNLEKQLPSYSDPALPLAEALLPALVEHVRTAVK